MTFKGKRVVVCGTGPTALSILHACAIAGADVLLLLSRDKERARSVLDGLSLNVSAGWPTPPSISPAMKEGHRQLPRGLHEADVQVRAPIPPRRGALGSADIIINATPVGMKPDDPAPFDTGLLRPGQVVMDAVYASGRTKLVTDALQADCKAAFNGGGMLVAQAVASALIVSDIAEVKIPYSEAELFNLMADAAGFDCPRA